MGSTHGVVCSVSGTSLVIALCITGGLLQVVGVSFTALRIRWIRLSFARPETPGFARWMRRGLNQARRRIVSRARKMIGRSGEPVTRQATAAVSTATAVSATLRIVYGPLDQTLPVDERLRIVDQRLRETAERLDQAIDALRNDQRQLNRHVADSHRETHDRIGQAEEVLARFATGDLRLSAWSVALILLGTGSLVASTVIAATASVTC
jgi:hypothetical protein